MDLDLAEKLPHNILFGTSSWVYPGWKGLVYNRAYKSEKELHSKCLEEYGEFPWFRTVGIDSTFYAPPKPDLLKKYASQLPPNFKWVSKVWEQITIPKYANHKRYGAKAGQDNLNFLDAGTFNERVLPPFREVGANTGPFVFQFQRMGGKAEDFFAKLDHFLSRVPQEYQYAIEIRNKSFLVPDYFSVLNKHGATHCFNHWTGMPPLVDQMKLAAVGGGLTAPFFVSRILTPLGVSYEDAVERFAPYDRIQAPNEGMRADLVRLARRAIERNIGVYVLVNNRAEGCAPLTIDAVGRLIIGSSSEQERNG